MEDLSPQLSSSSGMSRREAIKYLGRGAVVAGAVASGAVRMPVALAESSSAHNETEARQLRSVAWSPDGFYGLVESGRDVATIQRLLLDGPALRVSEEVIAEAAVGAGPAVMAVDASRKRFLVAHSTKHVLREFTYSFDLDADLAEWFEEQGVPAQETPTSGTGVYRESVIRPAITVISPGGAQAAVQPKGSLPEVSIEPVAIRCQADGYVLIATSSGRYGTETNLADEIVVVSILGDGSVAGLRPVVTRLGHDVIEVRALEASPGGFIVSVRGPEVTRFFIDSGGQFDEISPSSSLARFGAHDRIPVSGLVGGWLAEISPGVFAIEEVLDS